MTTEMQELGYSLNKVLWKATSILESADYVTLHISQQGKRETHL